MAFKRNKIFVGPDGVKVIRKYKIFSDDYCQYIYGTKKFHTATNDPSYYEHNPRKKYPYLVERYHRNGGAHRDNDLPAVTIKNRWEYTLEYYQDGKLHRDNNPASLSTFNNDKFCAYYRYGVRHRDGDLPAHIAFFKNGSIRHDYYQGGKLHRDINLGPALYTVGKEDMGEYYLNGVEVSAIDISNNKKLDKIIDVLVDIKGMISILSKG